MPSGGHRNTPLGIPGSGGAVQELREPVPGGVSPGPWHTEARVSHAAKAVAMSWKVDLGQCLVMLFLGIR